MNSVSIARTPLLHGAVDLRDIGSRCAHVLCCEWLLVCLVFFSFQQGQTALSLAVSGPSDSCIVV